LISHPNASRVELKMSRVKVILVAVLPAMFLLVSVDSFGDCSGCGDFRCLLSAEGGGKHNPPSADTSFDQVVQRCGRRINVQPGADGFSPADLAQTHTTELDQEIPSSTFPIVSLELAKSWQFLWRTALEPRAPSLVS
jgi:hypothetical protein